MHQHAKLVNLLYQSVNIFILFYFIVITHLFICVHTYFSTMSIQFVTILELPILNSTNEHQCCIVKHFFQAYLVDRALNTYVKPKMHVIIVFLKRVSLLSMDIDLNFVFYHKGHNEYGQV
jgi:hypothetical protein